jgi:hypothetical protein
MTFKSKWYLVTKSTKTLVELMKSIVPLSQVLTPKGAREAYLELEMDNKLELKVH